MLLKVGGFMKEKIINIVSNASYDSRKINQILVDKLNKSGYIPSKQFNENAELIISIGGDGTFIKALHKNNFPSIPIVGINTGHLGFYQEVDPDNIDEFIDDYTNGNYSIEQLKLIEAEVFTRNKSHVMLGVNEMALKAKNSKIIHMNVFVNRNHLEKFSGDGILISTPSGSTAYNFSLGGSLVHHSLDALQMTPMAPINSVVYRSLSSSIIIPGNYIITLAPEKRYNNSNLLLVDGQEYFFNNLKKINFKVSNKNIKKLVFSQDSYWLNLKSKFL